MSVVQGEHTYADGSDEYELAILEGTRANFKIVAWFGGMGVYGHLSSREVPEIMKTIN